MLLNDYRWTEDEISTLSWTYLQCNSQPDVIGEIMKLLKEDGITKSKDSVIRELYKKNLINKDEYKKLIKGESDGATRTATKEMRDDDISKLCMQLAADGKSKFLDWVQKVLLETCYAKIYLEKRKVEESAVDSSKLLNFEVFKKKTDEMPVMSPVSYHSLSKCVWTLISLFLFQVDVILVSSNSTFMWVIGFSAPLNVYFPLSAHPNQQMVN